MKQTWVSERHWMMVHTIDRFTELERRNYCLHQPFKPIVDTQLLMFDSNNVTYWRDPFDGAREWLMDKWFSAKWLDENLIPAHRFVMSRIRELVEMERETVLCRRGIDPYRYRQQEQRKPLVPREQIGFRPLLNSVYFAQDVASGDIKIGTSKNVRGRVSKLCIETRRSLVVLATVHGSYQTEREMHQRFANARIRGEWFRPVPELLAYIAEIKARAA